jgi:DNA-binding winged helix-turn-helix (wHTH) protein/TolB-like protein/Tfp pilus assembly protein PilF
MDSSSGPSRVRFGRFELDRTARELYCDGRRVRLQDQPLQVLAALLERPGEVVTRDDLRERLWTSDTFVDFEHGLNTAVKKARHALGDSAEAPQFIETLARRGYRFIGRVEASAAATDAVEAPEPLEPPVVPGAPPPRSQRPVVWMMAAFMLAVGTTGVWLAARGSSVAGPSPPASRTPAQLAVLPLRVLSSAADDSTYLGVGIADAITTRLANTKQIALRPTSAVLPYTDAQADPPRIAASLAVQHLLLGSVQRAGGNYRVTVQLVRADGVAIWGRTYDEPFGNLLAVQDHVAGQVVTALRIELSPPERARLHVRYTTDPDAYDLYLRGRSLLVNYTEARMLEAIGCFEQALARDPKYALAHAGIATAAAWFSVRYSHDAEAVTWAKRAEAEASAALDEDSSLADAHLAIASAAGTAYRRFDWTTVLERTSTALSLDPSLDLAHLARMRVYYHLGLFDEARQEGRMAQAVNPVASVEFDRLSVAIDLHAGLYDAAIARATTMLSRSDAPAIRHYLGLARYYAGDSAGARTMLASVMRQGQPDVRSQAALASVEAGTGMRSEARARVDAIARGGDIDHHVAYSLGAALAQLGSADDSVVWLERAANEGFPCYPWFARDPLLEPLRHHSRFIALLDRLRVAHEQAGRRAHP